MHVWEHSSTAVSGIRLVSSSKATVGLDGPAHALPERACVTLGRAISSASTKTAKIAYPSSCSPGLQRRFRKNDEPQHLWGPRRLDAGTVVALCKSSKQAALLCTARLDSSKRP